VNDAVFRNYFTTAFSPLMYASGSFAYMLSVTWAACAIAKEILGLVLAAQDNFARCSAARTNVVFTNSYVDNNSSLVSE
jgi:hypothetical protein